MANFRIPGPICPGVVPLSLDDGTLALCLTPAPGPLQGLPGGEALPAASGSVTDPDLSYIFVSCLNPAMGLGEDDYAEAAGALEVEVAAIKAVAMVETSGKAFDDNGRPRILFERHYFHRLTGGKYDAKHPGISNPVSGGYGRSSAQYGRLEEAYRLDADAALRSASWGRFQIMGDNFRAAGYQSAAWFVLAMTRSESAHLLAFTSFVKANKKMLEALQKKDWAGFARRYNGPAYEDNAYDEKIEAAYRRLCAPPGGKP